MQQNNLKPLVSVLTTCYNREKYIGEAIESVLASSYQNWELIITDDCSKDNSVKIANEYALKDERISVYVNEKNLGDYPNRNKAASYAKGKYLKYVDADDLIYPWGLQLLVDMMEKYTEAGWGLCSIAQDKTRPFPFMLSPKEAFKYNYFGKGLFHKAPLSSIIKREVFNSVGGFTGKQHLGDFEMWHRLALSFSVVLMPHGIVWYRQHGDQQMTQNKTDPRVNFKYLIWTRSFFDVAKDIPLSKSEVDLIRKKNNKRINGYIIRLMMDGKFLIAGQLFFKKRSTNSDNIK